MRIIPALFQVWGMHDEDHTYKPIQEWGMHEEDHTHLTMREECMRKILLTSLSKSEACMMKIILSCLSMMKIVHVRLSKRGNAWGWRCLCFWGVVVMLMAQTLKLVCTIWLGEEYGTWQVECQLSQSSANTYRQHKGSNCEQNKILPDAAREVTVSRAAVKMFGGLGHKCRVERALV